MDAGSPSLALAGVYDRTVKASLARIWENVFDWEHLPSLHAHDFAACTLLDGGDWGWRARLVSQPGDETRAQVIELRADRKAGRYCTTTLEGPGRGSEIRVTLAPTAPRATDVHVEFHVPLTDAVRLAAVGARYVEIYARLWDEDETMMRERERALARRRRPATAPRQRMLGAEAEVRAKLPLVVTFGGARFRIVDLDGALVAHAVTCPHWLGPLDDAPVIDGAVRCPWHGYVFDVRSGKNCDGRGLRLGAAPYVMVQNGVVALVPAPQAGEGEAPRR